MGGCSHSILCKLLLNKYKVLTIDTAKITFVSLLKFNFQDFNFNNDSKGS